MTDELISQIQSFTLAARNALESEAHEQLEGIYGWLPDGSFGKTKGYPALEAIDEARETRQRLEQFAEDEKAAGFDAKTSRRKLIRETAFTWLNRLAAFRLMEERKLLKQTIVRLGQSNGFIFWLTDEKIPESQKSYSLYQQGPLPLNPMGEGPADVAFRRFLLWQCGELARDVSLLFDPGTIASRLCPRPSVLKHLVTAMSIEVIQEAWKAGNEESIGWIYQAFNAEELQAAFAEAREQGRKFEPEDIPAVTQLFTIRWVVRLLVENTLGRLWVEMHPDSVMKEELGYLAPVHKSNRVLKPVREITFLDPCCGSMHFGLVAFDIFVRMYREEIANAGKPGWPTKPSAVTDEEIGSSIAEHNLFGIDLDLRAVQLSALTLLLRARTLSPTCVFTDQNLACANVEQLTAGRLDALISATRFGNRAEERILRALAARIADSPNLGSLLRLETDLKSYVDAERKQMLASSQPELIFSGLTDDLFATTNDLNAFFNELTETLAERLDTYARSTNSGAGHVAHEASKGFRYLRLVQRRYDVVVTNPPYLSNGKMNQRLQKLLGEQYEEGKQDLYAAFIIRCQEFLNEAGLMGMLTMHSFMFISSYEKLRAKLQNEIAIETLAHFGGRLFAVGNPGTLQTAAFVLRRELKADLRDENAGIYFRLVKEPDAEAKRCAFEAALSAIHNKQAHDLVFRYEQKNFDSVPGKPWIYWFPPHVKNAFQCLPSMAEVASPRVGLQSSDNCRFLKFWWEVGCERIAFGCTSSEESIKSQKKWFPHMKGGGFRRWWGNQEFIVNWFGDGREMKAWADPLYNNSGWSRIIKSVDFYFLPGATWSHTSSSGFSVRLMPAGFICNVEAMAAFPSRSDITPEFLAAILNSRLVHFILTALNPTLHIGASEARALPLPVVEHSKRAQLEKLAKNAVGLAKKASLESETTYDFISPVRCLDECTERKKELDAVESEIDTEVSKLYELTPVEFAAIDLELSGLASGESVTAEESEGAASEDELNNEADSICLAKSWISYAIGVVMGRFDIGTSGHLGCGDFSGKVITEIREFVGTDGIVASDKDHPQDIVRRVLACLQLMLDSEAADRTIRTATDGEGDPEDLLRNWIDRQFWKYHFQLYRKRPVYWPLQSPNKKVTVWVFHEKLGKDSLFRIKDQFVQVKINWINGRLRDLKPKVLSNDARERRAAEKEISQLSDVLDDVQDFAERLKRITERGYTPHIDDGVLLNAAPLWELLPSWKEAEKAWKELDAGDYDWAHQAMEYWPERVKEKCNTDKSFAIAHGLA